MAGRKQHPDNIKAIQRVFLDQLYRPCSVAALQFNPEHHPKEYAQLTNRLTKLIKRRHGHPDDYQNGYAAWTGRTWQSLIPEEYRKHNEDHTPETPATAARKEDMEDTREQWEKELDNKFGLTPEMWFDAILDDPDTLELAESLKNVDRVRAVKNKFSWTLEGNDALLAFLDYFKGLTSYPFNVKDPMPYMRKLDKSGVEGLYAGVWQENKTSVERCAEALSMSVADWLFLEALLKTSVYGAEDAAIYMAALIRLPQATQREVTLARGILACLRAEELFKWDDDDQDLPFLEHCAGVLLQACQQLEALGDEAAAKRYRVELFRLQTVIIKGNHDPQRLSDRIDEMVGENPEALDVETKLTIYIMATAIEWQLHPTGLTPKKVDVCAVLYDYLQTYNLESMKHLFWCAALRESGRKKSPLIQKLMEDDMGLSTCEIEGYLYRFSLCHAFDALGIPCEYHYHFPVDVGQLPLFERTMLRNLFKACQDRQGVEPESEEEKKARIMALEYGLYVNAEDEEEDDDFTFLAEVFSKVTGIKPDLEQMQQKMEAQLAEVEKEGKEEFERRRADKNRRTRPNKPIRADIFFLNAKDKADRDNYQPGSKRLRHQQFLDELKRLDAEYQNQEITGEEEDQSPEDQIDSE